VLCTSAKGSALHCNVLLPVVALSWLAVSAAVGVLVVLALLLVVISPWGARSGDSLDRETQARLLLNEDPEEIDRELTQRSRAAGSEPAAVARLHPEADHSKPLPFGGMTDDDPE
jgi:hypothetical protein